MTSDERPRKEDGSGLTGIDTRPIIFEPVSGAHLARTMNHNDPRKLFPHLRGRPRSFHSLSNFPSFPDLSFPVAIVIEKIGLGKIATIKYPSSFQFSFPFKGRIRIPIRTTFHSHVDIRGFPLRFKRKREER